MAVPAFQSFLLPLLRTTADGAEWRLPEAISKLRASMGLTDEDMLQLLPSGTMSTVKSRVGWARTYLAKAGMLEAVRHGVFRITQRGRDVLAKDPAALTVADLKRYPEFLAFSQASAPAAPSVNDLAGSPIDADAAAGSPQEQLDAAFAAIRRSVEADALAAVRSAQPSFLEQLVVDLLLAMGYGGSRAAAGRALGQSGDEGIDGVVHEDILGLDTIYVQAKRWESPVGRPELQKFAGALQGQQASKGVFITTSSFTSEARSYAAKISSRIVLLDGSDLAKLMYEHDIGLTPVRSYAVKRLDQDYFEQVDA